MATRLLGLEAVPTSCSRSDSTCAWSVTLVEMAWESSLGLGVTPCCTGLDFLSYLKQHLQVPENETWLLLRKGRYILPTTVPYMLIMIISSWWIKHYFVLNCHLCCFYFFFFFCILADIRRASLVLSWLLLQPYPSPCCILTFNLFRLQFLSVSFVDGILFDHITTVTFNAVVSMVGFTLIT